MGKPYLYLPISGHLREEITTWAEVNIKDEALDAEGREANPHITLAYGLSNNETSVVQALNPVMNGCGNARTTIKYATHFLHSKRSVLVLTCSSAPLMRFTNACRTAFKVPYTLNAHITLAYLRKGREVRTGDLMRFVGRVVEADHLVFVDEAKNHHPIAF